MARFMVVCFVCQPLEYSLLEFPTQTVGKGWRASRALNQPEEVGLNDS